MGINFEELTAFRNLSGYDYEKFALNILKLEAEARQKEIFFGDNINSRLISFANSDGLRFDSFDAVAPFGIYDSTFTVVEIKKTSKLINESVSQIKRIISRYLSIYGQDEKSRLTKRIKLLLIVSSGRRIKEIILEDNTNDFVDIWSFDDLIEKAKSYPLEYNAFLELAVSRSTNKRAIDAIRKETTFVTDSDFEAQNRRLITELNKGFDTNRICLVLGTGISMDYNDKLSWDALTRRMYEKLDYGKKFEDEDNSISIIGGDNVSTVQYSKRNLGDRYPTVLYNLIYPKKNAYTIGDTSLDECANLIVRKNFNVQTITKVITYNYDDFLEQALKARNHSFHVLYKPTDYLNKHLPLYHVHGYVPEGCKYAEKLEYAKSVVLSEEDYFNCYGDSSNWNVAIQLETFKDNICVFIGNSISDFNEKRLLSKTKQEKTKFHFAIFYTKGLDYSDLVKIYMHFFYELNIKIIWAKSLSDIPKLIKSI